ncbi:hypothetical protein JVU11DRAFT_5935 [Chiua virens]|nr:hypothetical protein JVU11DRAFT_5935 [Chiua virens]
MTDLAETTTISGPVGDESDEDASEAQAQVITSLRAQVTDLFSQVTQLNSKLVASYDRMSDLEDQLHNTSSSLRNATVSISSLELERSHHLAALNTGLLVEKAHVTAELNRLMERATEEAAQRGQAESARLDIEKDLDDLSATLFDQANTMVAEARLNQARSERKVQDAELALKIAEDAVKEMQVQMQTLQAEREAAEREAQEVKATMGKGKWIERDDVGVGEVPKPTPPVITTLLSQPFLARLVSEDSEPTVRLDLAPSLNWLSRRSVLAAIHSGMLTVEPLPFSSLVQELHQHVQTTSTSTLSCALCGTLIARVPSTPVSRTNHSNGSSWFKYPLALGTTQNHHAGTALSAECEPPGQVYIFRLAVATPSTPPPALTPVHNSSASMSSVAGTSSRTPLNPISSSRVLQAQTQNLPYPLCTSNYCLTRLRSTCSLWAFVRVGIVERVWEEDVVQPSKPIVHGDGKKTPAPLVLGNRPTSAADPSVSEKPPVPPRRRKLWEMASAFGERAVSWGKESGEGTKEKDGEKESDSAKKPLVPPPSHPSAPHPHPESPTLHVHAQAPPLPKRNIVRTSATTDTVASPSDTQNEVESSEARDPAIDPNGHADPDKADANAPDPSSPFEEITFASPPSESLPPPSTTLHPVPAEPAAAPSIQEQLPPPSPQRVPLPVTPTTPNPISRVASPSPHPRSRLSSPASPPSSRPASPAISRSRGGSPTPRATSPSPGHAPSASHLRGKISMSSPLASSAPASGPGVPPLPRRAAARRPAPPPPPTSDGVKGVVSHEETPPVITSAEPTPEVPVHKEEADAETDHDGEGAGETTVAQAEPAPATEAAPIKAVTVDHEDTDGEHCDVDGAVNGTSATVPSSPGPAPVPTSVSVPEDDGRTSMDTTSTKRTSSTEGEGFASDATWEERTWKEVVRLKEDMFSARIGGIRSA